MLEEWENVLYNELINDRPPFIMAFLKNPVEGIALL